MLQLCVVAVQVWYLEGRWVPGVLGHRLDVVLTVPVLVPVGLLLDDVELDVGGEAVEGLWICCRAMRRSRCVSTVASTTNQSRTTCGRRAAG